MPTFIKNNFDNMIKLSVNQIAMTIFGLLLSAAVFKHKTLLLVTGILSILFYMYLLYTSAWDIGARDKIKIDGGRMKKDRMKGFYLALYANFLNIILALFMIVCYYLGEHLLIEWAANAFVIANNIFWLINGMFVSVLSFANTYPLKLFLILASVIPALVTCTIAYLAGTNNFRVFGFLGLSERKKK